MGVGKGTAIKDHGGLFALALLSFVTAANSSAGPPTGFAQESEGDLLQVDGDIRDTWTSVAPDSEELYFGHLPPLPPGPLDGVESTPSQPAEPPPADTSEVSESPAESKVAAHAASAHLHNTAPQFDRCTGRLKRAEHVLLDIIQDLENERRGTVPGKGMSEGVRVDPEDACRRAAV